MIEINLLEKKRSFKAPVILGVDFAEVNWKPLVVAGILYYYVPDFVNEYFVKERSVIENQVKELEKQNREFRKQLKKNQNIKDKLGAFNKQIARLKERSKFVDRIIQERTNPRHVLEKVARSTPNNVWFEELSITEEKEIIISGSSTDYKSIGDFIVEANDSPFFNKSLQLSDSKTIKEEGENSEIRLETFSIKGNIAVYDPFMQ